ncbi:MAG: DegT/DnrJ/EryC1/StrS family aminotransferase [Candidatus Omnitrophica bacterium]|nr:DegT/DnrJ/EryC1/StrS family aminotransferase [Candidatus Omnitrophota bacterium]
MIKKKASDFRYDTGETRVPWSTVGEKINLADIFEIVKFLIRGKDKSYDGQFNKVKAGLGKLLQSGSLSAKLTLGNNVSDLEAEVKKFLKVKYALFITNATAGFEIAYKYAGIMPGDEVIAPAITFIATISYPLSIGAKVVLADVDPKTLNMDPEDVARKITKKTKVIIPVHLGGYPVDMDPIIKLARKHKITVIEDAAHAFGASYKGRMIGSMGDFGSFSFHEVKNITSLGEGGILVTNLPFGKDFPKARFVGFDIAHPIPTWLYDVVALKGKGGYFAPGNHSATEIQALVLFNQMKRLKNIIARRRQAAEYLNKRFEKVQGIILPPLDSYAIKSAHHLYLLKLDPAKVRGDVQDLKKRLAEKGITQIPHFAPLYKFSIMRQLGYNTDNIQKSCPNAEEAFRHRFTHLPLYEFSKSQLKYMADSVCEIVSNMRI